MTDVLLEIIAIIAIVMVGLEFILILILKGETMELFERVDKAVGVLENLQLAFEQFLDGVAGIQEDEFEDEDPLDDEWEYDEPEEEEGKEVVSPKAKKKKK